MELNNMLNLLQQFAPLLQNLNFSSNHSPFNWQNPRNQNVNQFDNAVTQKQLNKQNSVFFASYPTDTIDNSSENKQNAVNNFNNQNTYNQNVTGLNINQNFQNNSENNFQNNNQTNTQNAYQNEFNNNAQPSNFQSQAQNLNNNIFENVIKNFLGGKNDNSNGNPLSILSSLMGFLGKNNSENNANLLSSIMQKKDISEPKSNTKKSETNGLIKKFSKVEDVELNN